MKKILIVSIFIVIAIAIVQNQHTRNISYELQYQSYFEPSTPLEGSLEEMYKDVFITMLLPHIQESVSEYYFENLGCLPGVDPWQPDIIYIKRPNGYRTFLFEIKLEVSPYLGAHNTIGVDHITFLLSSDKVEVIEYKHIKSEPIPPWLR